MATIMRISVYSRYLTELDRKGIITISSGEIAEGVGVSSAQVRKDLAYFGEFGIRGVGYNVQDLQRNILKILRLENEWRVALVGAGHLGLALSTFKGFLERGFMITNIFDNDPVKVCEVIGGVDVLSASRFEEVVARDKAQIGIICVPAACAQDTANALANGGVKAILNFAPVNITVPANVQLRNMDMAVQLEVLTFKIGETEGS
jgi:redox-sensing transcriptional repressor